MSNTYCAEIPFIDLKSQQAQIADSLQHALTKVLAHGQYILGPEVSQLETALCEYTGAAHTISCASGSDALKLLLMALAVNANDAIFVPTFTFAATAEMVAAVGATPILVDILPQTFNLDPDSLLAAIKQALKLDLKPTGIIAVDLFGLPADYPALQAMAESYDLWIMADAAQSFGAQLGNKKAGNIINMSTTSFFPSKPLGGYGDGGAIFVQDAQLAHKLRSLRAHGAGIDRYEHVHIGINSRLDTLQAAILLEKLKIFPQELQRRQQIAQFYTQQLQNWIQVPLVTEGYQSAWAIYTLTCEMGQRAQLVNALKQYQIPYAIYYPKPLHLQPAYRHFPRATPHLVHAEDLAQRVLSIPMHPYLSHSQLEYIVYIIQHALSVAPQSLEPLTAKLIG